MTTQGRYYIYYPWMDYKYDWYDINVLNFDHIKDIDVNELIMKAIREDGPVGKFSIPGNSNTRIISYDVHDRFTMSITLDEKYILPLNYVR
jgi:hypothetical protein